MTEGFHQEQDLQKQIQELQTELTQLKTNNQLIWDLLVQIGNRLQRSSTSIKTAVSSLLDYDIFWDETTKYEFLQDIDRSTNELADLIILTTLAFRSQAKTLEITTEPNMIQEILVTLQNNMVKNKQKIQFKADYPPEGNPVIADYQYLSVALSLLIEVIISEHKNTDQLSLQAVETTEGWDLQINDLDTSIVTIIRHFLKQSNDITLIVDQVSPENALKLITAARILYLQNIKLREPGTTKSLTTLCLTIPAAVNHISIK
jgi:K+-sensing histidine kinase KdpD